MRSGTPVTELTEADRARIAAGLLPAPLTDFDRVALPLLEGRGTDHFYGAWKGGKAKGGGAPEGPRGIPHYDGIDNHSDVPKKADKISGRDFDEAAKGDRVVAVVAGKNHGTSVRGTVTGRTKSHVTIDADGTTYTLDRDAMRHFRVTSRGIHSKVAGYAKGAPHVARLFGLHATPHGAHESAFETFLTEFLEGKDDHFYGAWRGGKASQGGGPVGEDTMAKFSDGKGGWDAQRVKDVHEPYVASTMEGIPKAGYQPPTVYMTGGGPATGKTKGLIENPKAGIPPRTKAAHIDPDSAKAAIPEYQAGLKAGDKTIASHVHEESSHMSKLAIAANLKAGHDVVYDSVGDSGIAKLSAKVQQMRDMGASRVHASYATTSVQTAIARSDARALKTGRYVPHAYIVQAHRDVTATTLAAIDKGIFDKLDVWDNETTPRLIATYTKTGGLVVKNKRLWKRFTAKAEA